MNEPRVDNMIEIDTQRICSATTRNIGDFEGELNQLMQAFHFQKIDTPTGFPSPDYSKVWFSTPET